MTRKQLEELGLTKEQADKVIEINGGDIENAKRVNRKKRSRLLKKTQKSRRKHGGFELFQSVV